MPNMRKPPSEWLGDQLQFTRNEISLYYAARVPSLMQTPKPQWRGRCVIHNGTDDNFSVCAMSGEAFCHSQCGRGWDIVALEQALNGTDFKTAKADVFQLVGRLEPGHYRQNGDTSDDSPNTTGKKQTKPTGKTRGWREIERYQYVDRDGNLLYEVVRHLKPDGTKTFTLVRPSGVEAAGTTNRELTGCVPTGGIVVGLEAGKYFPDPTATRATGRPTWKRAGNNADHGADECVFRDCPRVPYRLPNILEADTVYLPEGEKDVHTLEKWGLVASCNPGGCGNSHLYAEWTDHFRGRHIVIVPDNDRPGRKHAAEVSAALLGGAASVRIVELPSLPAKGDVSDWAVAGGTAEQFRELTEAAALIDSAALSKLRARWGLEEECHDLVSRSKPVGAGRLTTRCLSDVEAKPIHWLWPGHVARGKLTIIAGDPGLGKSQITASIAAIVSKGGRWPVDDCLCKLGVAIFLSAEDDPADTLRPRLEAAGADLSRVHIVDGVAAGYGENGIPTSRAFSLQADVQALGLKLAELENAAVVVIDPITAYLGDTDSHKNADVRALLAPLSELAARYDVAVIGISHLNKSAGAQALMRVTGSLAFVAAARAAYLVTADPQDKTRRLLLPMKNNIGPDKTGLAFRIEGATVSSGTEFLETSRVCWESEAVHLTADQAIQPDRPSRGVSALEDAKDWLEKTLAPGPVPANALLERARSECIAEKTLQRASRMLDLRKEKTSMAGGWTWSLPPKVAKFDEGAPVSEVATFDESGHLRKIEDDMAEAEP